MMLSLLLRKIGEIVPWFVSRAAAQLQPPVEVPMDISYMPAPDVPRSQGVVSFMQEHWLIAILSVAVLIMAIIVLLKRFRRRK